MTTQWSDWHEFSALQDPIGPGRRRDAYEQGWQITHTQLDYAGRYIDRWQAVSNNGNGPEVRLFGSLADLFRYVEDPDTAPVNWW